MDFFNFHWEKKRRNFEGSEGSYRLFVGFISKMESENWNAGFFSSIKLDFPGASRDKLQQRSEKAKSENYFFENRP